MKYDSVAITTQPLKHLRKLHYKILNCTQCALVFFCVRVQLLILCLQSVMWYLQHSESHSLHQQFSFGEW
jgi:hypothetical protein